MIIHLLAWTMLMPSALAEPIAPTGKVVVRIGGMDCSGCEGKLTEALDSLAFLDDAVVSFAASGACASISTGGDTDQIHEVITGLSYTVTAIEAVEVCPPDLQQISHTDPWDDVEGLDAAIISHGERVDIEAHLTEGHYTVIDFGAPWCAPCHTTATTLRAYLAAHDDTAVRAITLDAADPTGSFALPVVDQHLKFAPGIPYFLVYAPSGRVIYKGSEVDDAIQAIDRKRSR